MQVSNYGTRVQSADANAPVRSLETRFGAMLFILIGSDIVSVGRNKIGDAVADLQVGARVRISQGTLFHYRIKYQAHSYLQKLPF